MSTSQPPPFTSLRLSDTEFAKYNERDKDGIWKRPLGANSLPIKVVGARDDVTEAIKMSNPENNDYLEVKWSGMDSMLWIMQRLEQQLKIPLRYWCLAGDGMVFSPGHLVGGIGMFQKSSEQPVLLLLPKSDVEGYLENNIKKHEWKRLSPADTTSGDPREVAKAKFHLIEPIESDDWAAYVVDRTLAEGAMDELYEGYAGGELDGLLDQIKENVDVSLIESMDEGEQQDAVADGVLVMEYEATDDGWGELRDCEVVSRIYSPTTPASVDVSFVYHHRTRYESVEWFYMICYRLNAKPSKKGTRVGKVPDNLYKLPKGWNLLSGGGLEDVEPGRRWRPIEFKEFGLSSSRVDALHRHLFGPSAEENLASRFHKVDMIKLMLSSVGVSYGIDAEAMDDDDITDGKQDGQYQFELCTKTTWLAVKVREACGTPLARDADFKDVDPNEFYDEDEDHEEFDESDDDYPSYRY